MAFLFLFDTLYCLVLQKIQTLIGEKLVEIQLEQRDRAFLWVPFFIAVGIGFYFSLKTEPTWPSIIGALIVTIGATVSYWLKNKDRVNAFLMGALIIANLIVIGFTAAKLRTDIAYTPMIPKKMQYADVVGTIQSIEPMEQGSRVILNNLVIEKIVPDKTPRKIRVTLRKDEGLRAGQRIQILTGLNPPSPPVAPEAFDFQQWAYFHGIGAVGFSYGAPEILEDKKAGIITTLRGQIGNVITKHTSNPEQSIILALMTGQRKAITEEDWEAMRASGLAHMLAISGLHVGMVATVLFFFSRLLMACIWPLALHHPIKKYAAIFAMIGAFFYMLMVGATIPTQRAMIMTALAMIAICFDRSPFSLRLVAFAAVIILLYRPESLLSVSFQMSFAAVTALVAFFDWTRPFWKRSYSRAGMGRKIALYFAGLSCTTIIAGFITGIFALYHFQQYAMYGLLANLIAVPILSIIVMPLLVLCYFLMPFGLSSWILSIAEYGVSWILATAHWVAGLSGAVFHLPAFPLFIFIGIVISFWWIIVWKGEFKKLAYAGLVILVGLIAFYRQPDMQITSNGDLIALQNQKGELVLSNLQKERFTADNWVQRHAQDEKPKWPKTAADEFPLQCDERGCRGEINGQEIAVSFSDKAWREDCQWSDIQIATTPMKGCAAPQQIDRFDLWRNGNHALWITPEDIIVKTVEEVRGKRPWTQSKRG
ncbi:MAG: ComEC/Rec2 family competence protein [Pseudomonadota bacterium]